MPAHTDTFERLQFLLKHGSVMVYGGRGDEWSASSSYHFTPVGCQLVPSGLAPRACPHRESNHSHLALSHSLYFMCDAVFRKYVN